MSKNIVFEGWLTKSPPSKRIWRTTIFFYNQKWRRRWFALRQSGELPGQYFLDYYADRNCRRLKGTINLDFCEQVDAGLHMERTNQGATDTKLRGSVFTIQTQSRTYHLEADCEAEMTKWVDAICCVCGLRPTDETPSFTGICETHPETVANENTEQRNGTSVAIVTDDNSSTPAVSDANYTNVPVINQQPSSSGDQENATAVLCDQYECGEGTGPYIPISECITGARAPENQRPSVSDTKSTGASVRHYHNTPQIRINNVVVDLSDDSNSEDEFRSFNSSQYNIGEVTVAKRFTKLNINQQRNNEPSEDGPPVPPRPPKTLSTNRDYAQRESFQGPRVQEPIEMQDLLPFPWVRLYRPPQQSTAPSSPGRSALSYCHRTTDDEDETSMGHSLQYYNLSVLPPAVDRALKPRHSSHSIGTVYNFSRGISQAGTSEVSRRDTLQYLDLDLHTPSTSSSNADRPIIIHGRSTDDADSPYKTVDFLKTEAFNITRQDAEAARSQQ